MLAQVALNPSEAFDRGAAAYRDYLNSPIGRLRTEVTWAQLRRELPNTALDVVDIGGGTGEMAFRLVKAGHRVTLVDPSPQMLAIAEQSAARQLKQFERGRLNLVRGELENLPANFAGHEFDLVVCHCTIEYFPQEDPAFRSLVALVKDQGFLSLVVPNRSNHPFRLAARGMLRKAVEAMSGPRSEPDLVFAMQRRSYELPALHEKLVQLGIDPVAEHGVRVAADLMPEAALSDYASVMAFELSAGSQDAYRQIARYLHVIAQRHAGDLARTRLRPSPRQP